MYYNMRVRNAQRTLAEIRLSLKERRKTMFVLPEESIRTLSHSMKNVSPVLQTFLKLLWQLYDVKLFSSNLQWLCCTKIRQMLSFECLSSLNVSSPGCQQVVRSLAPCWKTDQSIEVTQPVTTVVIQPWSTKSSARLLHSRRDWCSGRKGWMSQYIRKQYFTVLYTIWSHTVQYMFLHFSMQLTKQTLCEKKSSPFRIDAWYEESLLQASNTTEYTIQFLLMELESVGNIRLEEGCSTDPW